MCNTVLCGSKYTTGKWGVAVAYPGILFEGGSTNSVEDKTEIWGQ